MKYHVHDVLIQDIKDLLVPSSVTVCHTLREGDQCADFLVKLGALSTSNLSTYDSPPNDLHPFLMTDALGTFFP